VTLAILVALVAVGALLAFVYWLGQFLADARDFLDRAERGECTCSRHRLCPVCLEDLREERAAA
jgi:hypothetical protein